MQTMENILCFLQSLTELCLSLGLDILNMDLCGTFMGAVGLLLLYLDYLLLKSFLPTLWRSEALPQRPSTVIKRKGKRIKGQRLHQRRAEEAEEGRRLLAVVKSPLDQYPDTSRFRQLLCPDLLCRVCNRTTAKVSRLLSRASLEDAEDTTPHSTVASETELSSFLSSDMSEIHLGGAIPAPPPGPFPPSPSTLSPKQVTPLADLHSLSPLGNSLPPRSTPPVECKFPVGYVPPPPCARPHPSPHHCQGVESVIQPKATLPLKSSSSGQLLPTEVSVDRGLEGAGLATPAFSWQQPHAKDLSPPQLAQTHGPQQLPSSEASFRGDTADNRVGPRDLFFLSPDILTLLEREVKNRDFLMNINKMKIESFSKQLKTENQVDSAERTLESVVGHQDSGKKKVCWNRKVKTEEPRMHPQVPNPETFGDYLQQKCIQYFWGLPSLHSESLDSVTPVSADWSSSCVYFNPKSNASTFHESQPLPHTPPLSLSDIPPQALPQTLPQSQIQHVPPDQPRAHTESPPPEPLPPPPYEVGICGVRFHGPQNEAPSLSQSEIHNLEFNVLQKVQGIVWGLPCVVKKSREAFSLQAPELSLARHSSKGQLPISILPGDYPLSDELRKTLEHHLRKRLIQHRWGLPHRIHESLSFLRPLKEDPERSESKSSHGLSWISLNKCQSFSNTNDFDLGQTRSFHDTSENIPQEEGVKREEEHYPATSTKDHLLRVSGGRPKEALDSDSEKSPESSLENISRKNSRSSEVKLGQKNLTDNLKTHLNKKCDEINEGHIPFSVARSRRSLTRELPMPEKDPGQRKHKELAPLVGVKSCVDTSQDIHFLCPSKHKLMEDHIHSFQLRMQHGLPHRVQESIDSFNIREKPSQDFLHPSSSTLISRLESKLGSSKGLRNSKCSQAQDLPTAMPVASVNMTYKASEIPHKAVSGGEVEASQVYHVHTDSRRINLEQGQNPWVPTHVSFKGQDRTFLPAAKTVCPPAPKTGELGGGDAGLGTCPPRRKYCHPRDRTLEEAPGSKSSSTLSVKGQLAPEWLRSRMKQDGNTRGQKLMRGIGKAPEGKPEHGHGVEVTCPQEPLSSPINNGKSWCQAGQQNWAEPLQEHPFYYKSPCYKMPNSKAHSQEAQVACQSYPYINDRQPRNDVALQHKLSCQRHHPSMPSREPLPRPSRTCKCGVGQGSPGGPFS